MSDDEDIPSLVEVQPEGTGVDSDEFDFPRVPITIVTGYLGAGKSTLLNYILTAEHKKKIAVILNEFGDSVDIEKSITVSDQGNQVEEWLELPNGCICCSVRDTGAVAIEKLMTKRGNFDYILLETTGLADPGNIAPLFWLDDGLGSSIYLDGIVTLVDAANILRSLDDPEAETQVEVEGAKEGLSTAHLQISHADVIVINKKDLVTEEELARVQERVKSINGLARIVITEKGVVPNLDGFLLSLNAYKDVGEMDVKPKSSIDKSISTVLVEVPPLDSEGFELVDKWLREILWEGKVPLADGDKEVEIHRLKGRLHSKDEKTSIVQGVRQVFEMTDAKEAGESGEGKFVFIGRNLAGVDMKASYRWFVEEKNGLSR